MNEYVNEIFDFDKGISIYWIRDLEGFNAFFSFEEIGRWLSEYNYEGQKLFCDFYGLDIDDFRRQTGLRERK